MGMIIPADGIIISSTNLKLDEASLTGESNLMRKESMENCLKMKNDNGKYPSPMVFSGTTVKEGEGWMLVLATGPNSAAGKIREHVMQNKEDEESNKLLWKLNWKILPKISVNSVFGVLLLL